MTLPPPSLIGGSGYQEWHIWPSERRTNILLSDHNRKNLNSLENITSRHSFDVHPICLFAKSTIAFIFFKNLRGFATGRLLLSPAASRHLWKIFFDALKPWCVLISRWVSIEMRRGSVFVLRKIILSWYYLVGMGPPYLNFFFLTLFVRLWRIIEKIADLNNKNWLVSSEGSKAS